LYPLANDLHEKLREFVQFIQLGILFRSSNVSIVPAVVNELSE